VDHQRAGLVSGITGLLLAVAGNLLGAITVASDGSTRKGYSAPNVATVPGFGAMSPVSFADNAGIVRTIGALYWRSTANELVLAFPAGSPPNTDATFTTLKVGAATFTRATASSYGAWAGPGVAWSWIGVGDPMGAAGGNVTVSIT
jgi:hypothetical protein